MSAREGRSGDFAKKCFPTNAHFTHYPNSAPIKPPVVLWYSGNMPGNTARYAPALYVALFTASTLVADTAPEGWQTGSPRKEIAPTFHYSAKGGRAGTGAFVIETDHRDGLDGYWTKSFPVTGGKYYEFDAWRRLEGSAWPQQSGAVDIRWVDSDGKRVLDDRPLVEGFLKGFTPTVPLDYASDEQSSGGWTRVSAIHQAPGGAKIAEVRMHLRWAAKARAEWSEVVFRAADPPAPRKVRLATVHFRPTGRTPEKNREQFAPLIRDAARQKADLVVLPETLTYYGTGKPMVEI